MASIDLPFSADNAISTNSYAYNNVYNDNYLHTHGSYEWRSLIRPNFASLPANAIISAVALHICNEGGTNSNTIDSVYHLRSERVFVETQATGRSYKTGYLWTTVGAESTVSDRYSTSVCSINIPTNAPQQFYSFSFDVSSFISDWASGAGFLIKRTGGDTGAERYFRSRTYSGYTPFFRVTYSQPTGRRRVIWFT